jgi:hypothetical protein
VRRRKIDEFVKRHLIHDLKSYDVSGGILYRPPARPVLNGFMLDSSSSEHGVYLYAFVLPLYLPPEHPELRFSSRLDKRKGIVWKSQGWDLAPSTASSEAEYMIGAIKRGESFLNKLRTPADVINNLCWVSALGGIYEREAIAYSYAKLGCFEKAAPLLRKLTKMAGPSEPYWHEAVARSAQKLVEAIDDQRASEMLNEMEVQSLRRLRIAA